MFMSSVPDVDAQAKRASSSAPQIDVENYSVQATLTPDAHEIKAVATITFRPVEATDVVLFELSENLSVQKVLNAEGIELEFGQDENGPGQLSVRFSKPIEPANNITIKIEYSGGFDRDKYSRLYTRDESSAYIGMEGSYLLYSSKWFPINRFLVDRATATIEVNVPLGMVAIGPGTQMPVVTKGITETFGWTSRVPILPNSIVVGQYFERKVQSNGFTINCFSREGRFDAIEKSAQALAKILAYYQKTFGPSASGNTLRLVEVDDKLSVQPGMLGTIFVTHRELSQTTPAIRQLARRAAGQWWMDTVGIKSTDDLWLVDGMSYMSAALYIGQSQGAAAFKEELNNLAVLGLKFENKSAVRVGLGLGYRTEPYESVVAGKGAWVLIMLQGVMGEAKFNQLLQQYVAQFSGKAGSTSDFQKLADQIDGKELAWFFAEWIDTIGVPTLQTDYVTFKTKEGFRVSGTVKQDRDLFRMPLEVEVVTKGKTERTTIDLSGKSTPFDISTYTLPKGVVLDPDNRILRDSKDLQMSVQLSMGDDLRQKGDYVEAIRAYEAALKLNPHKSLAHYHLAEVFFDQFNLQSAANSFRDALNGDRDPKWIEVWCYIYIGKIYDILGQRQRALAEYNKALNTKDDTNGAQAEAKKWLNAPFTRERTTMGKEAKQPE
ncbi:MAG TPA: tetratricopeptide repeat protein [Acidobacteriota bacterium]|nr:tetratricopeptide repeat protein [Acidobacteriota bacterium]